MIIQQGGHEFKLFPSGAIAWNKTLLVADLHLGKESVFQKSGLAIPSGATTQTVYKLREHLRSAPYERLIVLGDLLHSPIGWTDELELLLRDAIEAHPSIRWELVAGNHDRRSHEQLRAIGWTVHQPPVIEGQICLLHEPDLEYNSTGVTSALSGHLHPSYKVPIDAKRSSKVPCFWIRSGSIVLPAFGGWVGTHAIAPGKADRLVLCVEGELIEWKL